MANNPPPPFYFCYSSRWRWNIPRWQFCSPQTNLYSTTFTKKFTQFLIWNRYSAFLPDPVAARSKLWVCGRSPAEIPPGEWTLVRCDCFVLSGRGLCDKLISLPGDSYWLCCVVVYDLETFLFTTTFFTKVTSVYVGYTEVTGLTKTV